MLAVAQPQAVNPLTAPYSHLATLAKGKEAWAKFQPVLATTTKIGWNAARVAGHGAAGAWTQSAQVRRTLLNHLTTDHHPPPPHL
ncbi:MAG: hypothetical protein ACYDA1_00620 [Vulcanimicrobiaceae bacterium]